MGTSVNQIRTRLRHFRAALFGTLLTIFRAIRAGNARATTRSIALRVSITIVSRMIPPIARFVGSSHCARRGRETRGTKGGMMRRMTRSVAPLARLYFIFRDASDFDENDR